MKTTVASWEQIARILECEEISDADLSVRLECAPAFVARVRADLRMSALPNAPSERVGKSVREIEWELFEAASTVTPDGHRQWDGKRKAGTPMFNPATTAYQFAFQALHGQAAEGRIYVECTYKQCVEGAHLSDRLMRERAQAVTP